MHMNVIRLVQQVCAKARVDLFTATDHSAHCFVGPGKGLYDPKQPLREVLRSLIYDSAEDDVVERKRMPADLAAKQLVKSPVPAASYASSAQRKTKGQLFALLLTKLC